jgi:hypothetical protein
MMLLRVVDDSMRPTLNPGDGLVAVRSGIPRRGQLRAFRDPRKSSRWLVKRVGDVFQGEQSVTFEARSDNPDARGAADSHEFGWVPAAQSYRVVWTVRSDEGR